MKVYNRSCIGKIALLHVNMVKGNGNQLCDRQLHGKDDFKLTKVNKKLTADVQNHEIFPKSYQYSSQHL